MGDLRSVDKGVGVNDAELGRHARQKGLLGVGIHGLHKHPQMSELKGEPAMMELDRDLEKFCSGRPVRRTEIFRNHLATYRRVAESLLKIDDHAVLTNRMDGSYDRSLRHGGFCLEGPHLFSMSHRIYLPYLPGGYMRVFLGLDVDDSEVILAVVPGTACFQDDQAGKEANMSYNDDRNIAATEALNDYLIQVSQPPLSAEAADK